MKEFNYWQAYALSVVEDAFTRGELQGNQPATVAALSLISLDWENRHPSYYNSQFAIGTFLLPEPQRDLRLYAWRMVLNGLAGYWQWHTHNGGSFSVTRALLHLGILSKEETVDTRKFNRAVTNHECKYFEVKPEFLERIVNRFDLPTTNHEIGGRTSLTEHQFLERERMKKACYTGGVTGVRTSNRERYERALANM